MFTLVSQYHMDDLAMKGAKSSVDRELANFSYLS